MLVRGESDTDPRTAVMFCELCLQTIKWVCQTDMDGYVVLKYSCTCMRQEEGAHVMEYRIRGTRGVEIYIVPLNKY